MQRAIASPVDHKLSRWPQYKASEETKPRYFHAYQGTVEHRLKKQVKKWTRQRERYGDMNARNWRSAFDLLDRATPDGATEHQRRMETVTLGDGQRAQWNMPSSEVVLELMQRTGAHLQAIPSASTGATFTAVSVWGTPAQNEHARNVLPEYMQAADGVHRLVQMYDLRSAVDHDLTSSRDAFRPNRDSIDKRSDSQALSDIDMIEDAEMELLEDALGDITNAPSKDPAPIRAVWAPSKIRILTRPPYWNKLTFAAYVDTLTTPMARLAQRKVYGAQPPQSTKGHIEHMTAELLRVFTGRESAPFASAAAVDVAVQFFVKYSNFPAVRRVFMALEDRNFEFTASNYDALFEAAAREESVFNFLYPLRLMIQQGVRPTARTWAAFHLLMTRRFPLQSNIVTEKMRQKGLFSNMDTIKSIAAGNADKALAAQLAVGKSTQDFLLMCEIEYGDRAIWLSAKFANKVSRVLLEHGRADEALEIVRELQATAHDRVRQGANVETLNTFLASRLRALDTEGALVCVRMFMPPSPSTEPSGRPTVAPVGRFSGDPLAIEPDRITFGILFGLAWNQRCYNTARVIWRRACAAGRVSFRMQDLVQRSLRRELEWADLSSEEGDLRAKKKGLPAHISNQKLWNALAGKFVVGVSSGLGASTEPEPEPARHSASMYRPRAAPGPDDDVPDLLVPPKLPTQPGDVAFPSVGQDAQLELAATTDTRTRHRLAKTLRDADMDEAGSSKPINLLIHDLERAWQLDELWKQEGLGRLARVREQYEGERKKGDVSLRQTVVEMFGEMVKRGVRVPMEVGDVAGLREVKAMGSEQHRPWRERGGRGA